MPGPNVPKTLKKKIMLIRNANDKTIWTAPLDTKSENLITFLYMDIK